MRKPIVKTVVKIRVWQCVNCGHEVPITPNLEGLIFEWYGPRLSKLTCPSCRSYTIQKSHNDAFTAGDFLIVKSKMKGVIHHG